MASQIIISVIALLGLAWYRAPLWVYSLSVGVALGVLTMLSGATALLLTLWTGYALYLALFHITAIRQKILTRPIYQIFKGVLPAMSQTEQAAIEAGDVWWDAQLLQGAPDWPALMRFQKPTLSDVEQAFIDNQVRTLLSMIDDWSIVSSRMDLSPEVWHYLKKERFFGMAIAPEYGGLGFGAFAQSTIISMLAAKSSTLAATAMVPNSLGPGELLQHYGTKDQKDYYLPRLAVGEEVPCFALTAPEAGSDAGAIPDKGVICYGQWEGREVLGVRLDWNKRYITLSPVATLLGLAFKLYDPDHLLGNETEKGITLCLVPTNLPGVEIGARHIPCGVMFQNGPTRGRSVFVPLDYIIGGVKMAGQGWRMLMECLSAGRGISLPALSTGSSQLAYCATSAYAQVRTQFGVSLSDFEGVQAEMAKIAGNNYRIEASRHLTAAAVQSGLKPSVISAIAKYHMTEMARQSMNCAMDIHGGRAVMRGPSNYLAECQNSMPVMITVEGANILTRNLMIFGQGAIRCHPFVQAEMQAAANPDQKAGVIAFDKVFYAHVGYFFSNIARCLLSGASGGYIAPSTFKGKLAIYQKKLNWMSSALACATDFSMVILGGSLKRRERLSAKLGDVLSELYLASAVLKYYVDQGSSEEDLPLVQWSLKQSLYHCQEALYDFTRNFPSAALGLVLRRILFPFGKRFAPPRDTLDAEIVKKMLVPGEWRSRQMSCIMFTKHNADALWKAEKALLAQVEAREALKTLKKAQREGKIQKGLLSEQIAQAIAEDLLTQAQAEQLKHYDEARLDAINVDEFSPEYFTKKGAVCNSQTISETSTW